MHINYNRNTPNQPFNMKQKDYIKVKDLEKMIDEFIKSGKSLTDFRNENMFKEYSECGTHKLKDIAAQYFLDHLK